MTARDWAVQHTGDIVTLDGGAWEIAAVASIADAVLLRSVDEATAKMMSAASVRAAYETNNSSTAEDIVR